MIPLQWLNHRDGEQISGCASQECLGKRTCLLKSSIREILVVIGQFYNLTVVVVTQISTCDNTELDTYIIMYNVSFLVLYCTIIVQDVTNQENLSKGTQDLSVLSLQFFFNAIILKFKNLKIFNEEEIETSSD